MWDKLIEDVTEVINNDAFINIVLNKRIGTISENDRKLYTKILYGVVENKKWLDFLLRPYVSGKRVKPNIKNPLRVGVYALSYLNLASHYVVNELVGVVKKKDYNGSKFVNGVFRNYIKEDRFNKACEEIKKIASDERESIIYNIDVDVLKLIKKQYPNDYVDILKPVEETFNIYRINYLKTTDEEVIDYLNKNDIWFEKDEEMIITKVSLIQTTLFEQALIIPQDASSMMVGKVLNPPYNACVLDACSAPGSKSFHLATIMKNTGSITSCDIYPHKLKLIENEALRQGIKNIKTLEADARNFDYGKSYAYVLVDAPCSGMGTMKHKGDLKLRLTINKIKEIDKLQKDILNHIDNYVEPNGILVYSTCTINKSENEEQIRNFLKSHKNYQKVEEKSFLPTDRNDGFYICKLKKGA